MNENFSDLLPFWTPVDLASAKEDPGRFHILTRLQMPDRYEDLAKILGTRVADLLVPPGEDDLRPLRMCGQHVRTRSSGQFLPIVGETGVGKTTLASTLRTFLPDLYTQTYQHRSAITVSDLSQAIESHLKTLAADDRKIVPVLIDDREAAPPTPAELASIKSFLRQPHTGARCVVVWPEVTVETAAVMSNQYQTIAGGAVVELPINVGGPSRGSWQDIARNTLQAVNSVHSVGDLGISIEAFDPGADTTLGNYLRRISIDFTKRLDELLQSTQRPINLVIAFVTESLSGGVLAELTTPARYGFLDAGALVSATPQSDIGRWWKAKVGALGQTIIRLNARGFAISPSSTTAVVGRYGPDELRVKMSGGGWTSKSPVQVNERFQRSDLGRYLTGQQMGTREARGAPATEAKRLFKLIAGGGLTSARDKALNRAFRDAIEFLLTAAGVEFEQVTAEKGLQFCDLIPDNTIIRNKEVVCVEYAWRAGEHLEPQHRSDVAQYILRKLRSYAEALSWL